MTLSLELANQLSSFLAERLSLSAYREAMMRVRVETFDSMQLRDKSFLLEFETRYAQLKAGAITEYQFKQLLAYAAVNEPVGTNEQPEVWFYAEPDPVEKKPVMGTNTEVTTWNSYRELVNT
jgi:hypothetical protein